MVQRPSSLWVDGHDTYHGKNDQVPQSDAGRLRDSLVLIRPKTVRLQVSSESQYEGGS